MSHSPNKHDVCKTPVKTPIQYSSGSGSAEKLNHIVRTEMKENKQVYQKKFEKAYTKQQRMKNYGKVIKEISQQYQDMHYHKQEEDRTYLPILSNQKKVTRFEEDIYLDKPKPPQKIKVKYFNIITN